MKKYNLQIALYRFEWVIPKRSLKAPSTLALLRKGGGDRKSLAKIFYFILNFILLGFAFLTPAWAKTAPAVCPVTQGEVSQALYFSGVIAPIRNIPVVSPTAGVIEKRFVVDGERVLAGQKLLQVDTRGLDESIRAAQVNYLNAQAGLVKARESVLTAENTYQENLKLYQYGVISHDTLVQSQEALEQTRGFQASGGSPLNLSQSSALEIATLQLENAKEKYEALLSQQKNSTLIAPVSGIVLKPPASASNSTGGSPSQGDGSAIDVGSHIHYQQVLLGIGDMSGLKVQISVPENAINLLALHQSASLTSPGFPGLVFTGEITEIGAEASSSGGGGGVAQFPVTVEVPNISIASQDAHQDSQGYERVRAGMDAQVKVVIYHATGQLSVPISALKQTSRGQASVWVINPVTHKPEPQVILTGKVSISTVQVLKGLTPQDQVLCDPPK